MTLRDLRYALRSLRKSPGFVVIAVLALGIGLGLSTTMFAVVDAVLHPVSAYRDAENLFEVSWRYGARNPLPPGELYRYVRDHSRSFQAVTPVGEVPALVEAGGDLRQVLATSVSARWFTVTGVRPRLGRGFTASDGDGVALLGDRLFRSLYGNRRQLSGSNVLVNRRVVAVVGVLPRGAGPDLLLPLSSRADQGAASPDTVMPLVRLKSGVTVEAADRDLQAMAQALTERYGTREAPFGFRLSPLMKEGEDLQALHGALLGAAFAVLLIACQNLAHLMMARGLARRRETALRLALGATRAAVVWQLFLEAALVTLGGASLGALMAVWGSSLLQHEMPQEVSWIGLMEPQLSWRVFAAACLCAAGSAVLFGLLPTMRVVSDVSLDEPLRDESGASSGRIRRRYDPLVAIEVAVTLVLMMGAGLLLRTVHELRRDDPGIDPQTLFRATVQAPPILDTAARYARRARLLSLVEGMPEVRDVADAGVTVLRGAAVTAEMTGQSVRLITMGACPDVTPNYLRVLGLPILQGRDFESGDVSGPGVAIVDPIAAQRLYPGHNPVGHMLKLGGPSSIGWWVRIVGLVRSPYVQEASMRYAPQPAVFVVHPRLSPFGELLIRTKTRDPRALVSLQTRLHEIPGISVGALRPWDEARAEDLRSRGFLATVFVTTGVVALALAALGLYGVLSYAVNRRRREYAIRVALGAEPGQLLRNVLNDGGVMLLTGTGVGAVVGLFAGRLLDAVLVTITPADTWALVLSEAVLLSVGIVACLAPALRAMRTDPVAILRAT